MTALLHRKRVRMGGERSILDDCSQRAQNRRVSKELMSFTWHILSQPQYQCGLWQRIG